MSQPTFNSVIDLLKVFPNQKACIKYLEAQRWPNGPVSPFDESSKVYKCKGFRYRCKNTGKYFNVMTGTMFHNTKIDLQRWFFAMCLINENKKGYSSVQLAKDIQVTQKTAWFMLHRIRNCYGCDNLKPEMKDNVQMDETFVGGKNKNRHKAKKIKNSQGRSFKDKTPVFGMMSEGKVFVKVVDNTSATTIQPIILDHVKLDKTIITDEWSAYRGLSFYYDHQVVFHNRGSYMTECGFTSNGIENFWGVFKRGIIGIYQKTSRKHLQRYADEFAFRRNTMTLKQNERFNTLLIHSNNRLPYKILIHENKA